MKTNANTTLPEVLHRLVIPIQTRGNLGKSTEAIARCEWMNRRGVAWSGYDLDAFNRTLSGTYEKVRFIEVGQEPKVSSLKSFVKLPSPR